MRDFEDSTLWRISAFERMRNETGSSGFMRFDGPSVLPSTLLADLRVLERENASNDALEVVAACLRHREAALLYLRHEDLVWPITLFPQHMLYHSPREMLLMPNKRLADMTLLACEPPGVRPPGHRMHERVGHEQHYHPLPPLLWWIALNGPRSSLLREIGGTAAYRVPPGPLPEGVVAPGALGSAVERLRRDSAAVRDIASWPGLSVERASRMLNALYLTSSLMVSRANPAARDEPGLARRLLGVRKR